jgi:hypothetical protein
MTLSAQKERRKKGNKEYRKRHCSFKIENNV